MNISIPQIVSGVVTFFIATLGIALFSRVVNPIFNLSWASNFTYYGFLLGFYLVIAFVVYVIVYGTITGKTPNIMNKRREEEYG